MSFAVDIFPNDTFSATVIMWLHRLYIIFKKIIIIEFFQPASFAIYARLIGT